MDRAEGRLAKAAKVQEGNCFDALPRPVLLDILTRVGEDPKSRYAEVCKLWHRLSAVTQRQYEVRLVTETREDEVIRRIRRFSNLSGIEVNAFVVGSVTDVLIASIGACCPQLQIFKAICTTWTVSSSAFATFFKLMGNLRELHLSITTVDIPEEISALQQLQVLSIDTCFDANTPPVIPDTIGDLCSLRELVLFTDLMSLGLEAFPEAITRLTQLRKLHIFFLTGQLPRVFGSMVSLQDLKLNAKRLTALPESFGDLRELTTLKLGCRRLTTLPPTFTQLLALRDFSLHCEGMRSLPEPILGLSSLTRLELFDIRGRDIRRLHKLCSLRTLELESVKGRLPSSLCKLSSLEHLSICQYDFWLPHDLGCLSSLTKLELEDLSYMGCLPPTFCSLTGLQDLRLLDMPRLSHLPPNLGDLVNLKFLQICGCHLLARLPKCIAGLRNLETLEVGGMGTVVIAPCFTELTSLQNFEIFGVVRRAPRPEVPEQLLNLPALTESSRAHLRRWIDGNPEDTEPNDSDSDTSEN